MTDTIRKQVEEIATAPVLDCPVCGEELYLIVDTYICSNHECEYQEDR